MSTRTEQGPSRHRAYVALGGNLGDVLRSFRSALAAMASRGIEVTAVSAAYRTQAVVAPGAAPGPDYWNAACAVRTQLGPRELLAELQAIETGLGRVRRERWAARTLDLDLVLYDELAMAEPDLTLPHPRMAERAFVLRPLAEIAADVLVPGLSATVSELLARHPEPGGGILERRPRWAPRGSVEAG